MQNEDEYVLPTGWQERNAQRAELAAKRADALSRRRSQAAKLVAAPKPEESRATLRELILEINHAQALGRDAEAQPGSMEFVRAGIRDAEKRTLFEALGRVVGKINPPYVAKIFVPELAYVVSKGKVPPRVAQATHLQLGKYDSMIVESGGNDLVGVKPETWHHRETEDILQIVNDLYEREARFIREQPLPDDDIVSAELDAISSGLDR